jgi:hypothetical protein
MLENRYMKEIKIEENSILRCRINCSNLGFPMKFETVMKNLSMVVLIDYDRMPSVYNYNDYFDQGTFTLSPDLAPGQLKYLGILIISKTRLYTEIGCCFKSEVKTSQKFEVQKRSLAYKSDMTYRNIMNYGLDYDLFLDVKLKINKNLIPKPVFKKFIWKNKMLATQSCENLILQKYKQIQDSNLKFEIKMQEA